MGQSTNIRITGLSFVNSPTWTMAFYGVERMVIDGVYVYTKTQRRGMGRWELTWTAAATWHIVNSSITTGDDCIIFISGDAWGTAPNMREYNRYQLPALGFGPYAIKFSEGTHQGSSARHH